MFHASDFVLVHSDNSEDGGKTYMPVNFVASSLGATVSLAAGVRALGKRQILTETGTL